MIAADGRGLDYRLWIWSENIPERDISGRPNWFGPLRPVDIRKAYGYFNIARGRGSTVVVVGEGADGEEAIELFRGAALEREKETRVKSPGEAFLQAVKDKQGEEVAREVQENWEKLKKAWREGPKISGDLIDAQLRSWGFDAAADERKRRRQTKPKPEQTDPLQTGREEVRAVREWKPWTLPTIQDSIAQAHQTQQHIDEVDRRVGHDWREAFWT